MQLTSWRDVCEGGLQIYSSCPKLSLCEDILDGMDETIRCNPLQPEGSTSPRSKASDPQVGTSEMKTAAFTLSTTQLRHDVIIADDMKASVAAMVLSKFLLLHYQLGNRC